MRICGIGRSYLLLVPYVLPDEVELVVPEVVELLDVSEPLLDELGELVDELDEGLLLEVEPLDEPMPEDDPEVELDGEVLLPDVLLSVPDVVLPEVP